MKRILSFMLTLCLLASAVIYVSAEDFYPQPEKIRYAEKVLAKYNVDINSDMFTWEDYFYEELYDYYNDKDVTPPEFSTPDYVLIFTNSNFIVDTPKNEYIGPYIFMGAWSMWGTCGYHIYFPVEDILYSVEEAYNAGVEGIDETILGADDSRITRVGLLGDVNDDSILNIKDATYIQKLLAGIFKWNEKWYTHNVSDFNRDGERNIKDATAIQKHIAGLPY